MANQPGQRQPSQFRSGMVLSADQMNQILNALIRRIEGGKGINIRSFKGKIVVESSDL